MFKFKNKTKTTNNTYDYSKCTHYPWMLIDEDCPNCESYSCKKDNNSFYCMVCDDFTRHSKKYANTISCTGCNNIKRCVVLQNPNEDVNCKQSIFILPYNHIIPNEHMLNQKCKNCNGQDIVEYIRAYFYCTIDGINNGCIDINRPLCNKCHLRLCNKKTHKFCK